MKMINIVGARPQIIKAAAISRAIKNFFSDRITEVIVHTGQHYDSNMTTVFFNELLIPKEKINLKVGSGSHAVQTASMMIKIADVLMNEKPTCVLVYGDTNSTLAAALVASKIPVPIIHVEAGLRNFKKKYPEEINRIVCDHLSTLLFVPTIHGCRNLTNEGFKISDWGRQSNFDQPSIFFCGDIMYDNSIFFLEQAKKKSIILERLGIKNQKFILATIHRPHNTDYVKNLSAIFSAFDFISKKDDIKLIIPLHPRTLHVLHNSGNDIVQNIIERNKYLKITDSVSYLDMIRLEESAELIFTDSGGVQKEAYFYNKPVVLLMEETPWVELVETGCAMIGGSDSEKIINAYYTQKNKRNIVFEKIYGDGHAAEFICKKIIETFDV
ncbi:MAG: UDP-N-acetylglucosamine 2-epimerase [Bacteroidetes bacterium RIFCSPLOWO2_02_FULL_36_8]|nr:MAG: UDP-N-acetylglucosamine 2-epimerase [Bacteroidetes bacterium RIFCSPLOWO2_02_FULL_36_8]OFY71417.1 MAG: UDP-N-acetylglucosamine 2-epimerase [Bacteroidetes bacterium RIFCSPLOWO2_12_FULL_37_12]